MADFGLAGLPQPTDRMLGGALGAQLWDSSSLSRLARVRGEDRGEVCLGDDWLVSSERKLCGAELLGARRFSTSLATIFFPQLESIGDGIPLEGATS